MNSVVNDRVLLLKKHFHSFINFIICYYYYYYYYCFYFYYYYCSLNISYVVSASLFYFCYIRSLVLYLVVGFKFF